MAVTTVRQSPIIPDIQNTPVHSDRERVATIKKIFSTVGTEEARAAIATEAPSIDVVNYALKQFRQIQDSAAKMEVFAAVLWANNVWEDIAKEFYSALPNDMQDRLRFHIYEKNNRNDEDRGLNFGHHVVENRILDGLTISAARSYRDELYLQRPAIIRV
jgi:hypothetical protein